MAGWIIGGVAGILFILMVRGLFKKVVPSRVTYALWLFVLIRLLCPFNFGRLPVSVLNIFPQYKNYEVVGKWQDGYLGQFFGGGRETADNRKTEGGTDYADAAASSSHTDIAASQAGTAVAQADVRENNAAETADHRQTSDAYVENDVMTDTSDVVTSYVGSRAPYDSMANGGISREGTQGVGGAAVCMAVWITGEGIIAFVLFTFNIVFFMRLRRSRKAVDVEACEILRMRGEPEREEWQENGRGVWEREARQCARHTPPVYVVKWLATPCMFGLFRPSIYLNEDALNEDRRDYCIAHEYSHYLQRDYIWSFMRSVCLVLHWYNPLVWLAVYLSKKDGELACDERTLARLGGEERYSYGHVLLEMSSDGIKEERQRIKRRQKVALLLFGTATMMNFGKKEMRQRIKAIASGRKTKKLAVFMAVLITFLAVPMVFTDAKANEPDVAGLTGCGVTELDAAGLTGYGVTELDVADLTGCAGVEFDVAGFVDYEEMGQLVLMLPKGTTVAADFCKEDGAKRKLRIECDADSGIEKEGYDKNIFGKAVGRDTVWQRMTDIYYVMDIDADDGCIEGAAYGRLGYPADEYLYLTFFHFVEGRENYIKMVGKLPLPKEGNYTHMVISADDDRAMSRMAEVANAAGNVSEIWGPETVNVVRNLSEMQEPDMMCWFMTVINGDGTVYSPYCFPILDGLWVQAMWRMRGENLVFEQQSEYVPYSLYGNKNEYAMSITKDVSLHSSPDNDGEAASVHFNEGDKVRVIGVSRVEWQPYRRYNASQLDSFWLGLEREDGTVGWMYCDNAQTCGDYVQ